MTTKSSTSQLNGVTISALSLLCIAGCLRFTSLGNLPGINADEAYMGLPVLNMLNGKPCSFKTPMGQYINPLYIASETFLFKFFGHDFVSLRLPAACFSAIGILILIYLFWRIFDDWRGAIILGVVAACSPAEMIYSRLGWDATFMLFWTPVLLYLAMRLQRSPRRHHAWLLVVSIPLVIWTHATSASFLLAIFAAALWIYREEFCGGIKNRLSPRLSAIVAGNGVILFSWFVAFCVLCSIAAWFALQNKFWEVRNLAPSTTLHTLSDPNALAAHLRIAADLFTGYRPLRYIVGMPESPGFAAFSWIVELLLVVAAMKLAFSKNPLDRFLAVLFFFYSLLIILQAGTLMLQVLSYERYVMPLIVLVPLIFVRVLPSPVWMIISVLMLVQYWQGFEQPTLQCRYPLTEDHTYWTGLREPKAAAADLLRYLAGKEPASHSPVIYASRYWIERPLQFLLYSELEVTDRWPGAVAIEPGDFVAGFSGEDFIMGVQHDLKLAGRKTNNYVISNQAGVEQIVVLQLIK